MFKPNLEIGHVVDNNELRSIFKCGMMGGMRRSNETNSLVLISDHTKGLYEDRWEGDILHYTGMGKLGDQDINFSQNKTLNESRVNNVNIFLFEVVKKKEYIFLGEVELVGEPYKEHQPDEDRNDRLVWIFPVRSKQSDKILSLSCESIMDSYNGKVKKARRLSKDELERLARTSQSRRVSCRTTTSITYERNAYVAEYAKRKANGICQLCNQPAPFNDSKGNPYLESHHIIWLSRGGNDTIENTVALCPNCHRKIHILDNGEDVKHLIDMIK